MDLSLGDEKHRQRSRLDCPAIAPLTFTVCRMRGRAQLAVLKEDGVHGTRNVLHACRSVREPKRSLLEGEGQREVCRMASTPNLLRELVKNK